jgi:hypothetical protein
MASCETFSACQFGMRMSVLGVKQSELVITASNPSTEGLSGVVETWRIKDLGDWFAKVIPPLRGVAMKMV